MKIYNIAPVAKPRMTRQDKNPYPPRNHRGQQWPRPIVAKYWNFKNQVIAAKLELPEQGAHVIFRIKMPKSWSMAKKREMNGRLHKQTPDLDNLLKGLCDAVFKDDSVLCDIRATKIWANKGSIQIFKNGGNNEKLYSS